MVASAQRARKESAGARVRDRCPQVLALLAALCAALAFLVGACAPPAQRATGTEGPALYVANGLDRTISRIERDNGRALGAPVSVPGVPAQVVAAGDIFVVLATDERGHQPRLISFSRHGSGWATHTWALEARAEAVLLAGAGPRYAVAAYRVGSPAAGADEAPVGNTRSTGDSEGV